MIITTKDTLIHLDGESKNATKKIKIEIIPKSLKILLPNEKNKKGVIYSTNPNFQFEYDDYEKKTLSNNEQLLTLHIDKHRAGKTVIIIKGFIGSESDLKKLGKKIKKNVELEVV